MKTELKTFDNPLNVKRLLMGFYIFLALLLAAELFVHKHPDFPWEGKFGFFAAYGFISNALLIVIAKGLRRFIKRDADYYR